MTVTKRLLAAIWIFVFAAMGLSTVLHVRQERQRLVNDEERRRRMRRLHRLVREQNVYGWAGQLLGELSRVSSRVPAAAST